MVMVPPERETPGTSAHACAKPISSESRHEIVSSGLVSGSDRSITYSRIPITISVAAISNGARSACSATFSSSTPMIAAGSVAMITELRMCSAGVRVRLASPRSLARAQPNKPGKAPSKATQSFQKYTTSATSVPRCSATSKVSESITPPCQPNSHGTKIKCADDEIGKNSPRPCTTPIITGCV
ncbi:hypothetical protein SE17_12765 [Kouleothrix aurantiaca]|uniref:Uncharacterized protein n=1 Tax=Kouleothrix aurantiaca TaxID=186479 RepID=A0A0P9D1T4_9CHLR|nr:hypothetical protein SE17_12765 [Kouleothrix aurantiaca]